MLLPKWLYRLVLYRKLDMNTHTFQSSDNLINDLYGVSPFYNYPLYLLIFTAHSLADQSIAIDTEYIVSFPWNPKIVQKQAKLTTQIE